MSFSVQPEGSRIYTQQVKRISTCCLRRHQSRSHTVCSRPGRCSGPSTQARGDIYFSYYPAKIQFKLRRESAAAAAAATAAAAAYQTLVAVAACHVSLAGAVAADLVAGSPHHDDATRVAVARCCKNKRERAAAGIYGRR